MSTPRLYTVICEEFLFTAAVTVVPEAHMNCGQCVFPARTPRAGNTYSR